MLKVNTEDQNRIESINALGRKKADLIEAALAAADYAYKIDNHQDMTWATLEGGAYVKSDLPT